MQRSAKSERIGWDGTIRAANVHFAPCDWLLSMVDAGLCGIICVAPFFFGGRHDLGRLVFVALVAVVSVAWFVRQSLLPAAHPWPRTAAKFVPLAAAVLLVLQLVPLPWTWLTCLAPQSAELLTLWTPSGGGPAQLGTWQTLSVTPHETVKALAMLLNYGLLFLVVAGRIQNTNDIRRVLDCVAISAAVMAVFGIAQYFTSDGRFFWFFDHSFREADNHVTGAFINRNHFAGFVVLGIGPLAAWLLREIRSVERPVASKKLSAAMNVPVVPVMLGVALTVVVLAVLGSRSRGGTIVMLVSCAMLALVYARARLLDSRSLLGLAGLAAAVVAALSLYGYDEVSARLDDFGASSIDEIDHGAIRRTIWSANIAAIRDAWLTGWGAGSHSQICPVYLGTPLVKEYTHAENGYLQIATELGVVGVVLLASGFGLCVAWCVACWRRVRSTEDVLLFGAAAAGLAASIVHSLVDFVWYIPACLANTLILAACVLRLSQMVRPAEQVVLQRTLPRGRWLELCAASVLVGGWSCHVYWGPAVAAIHWDRYLRAAVVDRQLEEQSLADFIAGKPAPPSVVRAGLAAEMLHELQTVVHWNPHHFAAHSRLADRYIIEFENRTRSAENYFELAHLRDAVLSSAFASSAEMNAWLDRVYGRNIVFLRHALRHAGRAVELCPLRGEAYLYLADLCFLDRLPRVAVGTYVDAAHRSRPFDKDVLAKCGIQKMLLGQADEALALWAQCFNTPGRHQNEIVYRLAASGMPAKMFVEKLHPELSTFGTIWAQYRVTGRPQDAADLLSYAEELTTRELARDDGLRPAVVWYRQSVLYADVGRDADALRCLETAHASDPNQFAVRAALSDALIRTGRLIEAEPHVRWCLARRPENKRLQAALSTISRHRFAARSTAFQQQLVGRGTTANDRAALEMAPVDAASAAQQ